MVMFTNLFIGGEGAFKNKNMSTVRVTSNSGEVLDFPVNSIFQRKKKEDFQSASQNSILNAYVNWKGNEYMDELFNRYNTFHKYVTEEAEIVDLLPGGHNKVERYFNDVLDMLDYDDIKNFLINVYQLEAPAGLKSTFDTQDYTDGVCSREQTYTKDDYKNLVVLIVIVKASYFLLGLYANQLGTTASMSSRDHSLFKYYKKYDKVFFSEAMDKLLQFTEKLIESKTESEKDMNVRIIEKVVSEDEISILNIAQIVFQKLTLADIDNDTGEVNIVTMLYTFLTNKLRETGNNNGKIRDKTVVSGESEQRESESHIENHRGTQDIMNSETQHLIYATETVDRLLVQISDEMRDLVEKGITLKNGEVHLDIHQVREIFEVFRGVNVPDNILRILETIFKGVMDPRGLVYTTIDSVLSMLSIGFVYMWNLGYKDLAMLMGSTSVRRGENYLSINSTSGKTRISKELLEQAVKLFPFSKSSTKGSRLTEVSDDDEYEIKKWVENFGNDFYTSDWSFVLPKEFSDELNLEDGIVRVPEDIKSQIVRFLIDNESKVYRPRPNLDELVKKRPRISRK